MLEAQGIKVTDVAYVPIILETNDDYRSIADITVD